MKQINLNFDQRSSKESSNKWIKDAEKILAENATTSLS